MAFAVPSIIGGIALLAVQEKYGSFDMVLKTTNKSA
jgi:AAHS family benzoate transporter-like MFS transporter